MPAAHSNDETSAASAGDLTLSSAAGTSDGSSPSAPSAVGRSDSSAEPTIDLGWFRTNTSAPEVFPHVDGYMITGRLGEGGMGTVWRAVQLATRRDVAIKLMGQSAIGSERARRRFEREVELAASLEHPNIAQIHAAGRDGGAYFYAMQLIDGVALDEFAQNHRLDERALLQLMLKVCQAVEAAHQRGVIHRDLKPSNILVTADSEPHVLDFGLAKTTVDEADHLALTQEGEVAGTPAYMAPEQARGDTRRVDVRADVYALGVILYRLLTGAHPHDLSGSRFEVLRRIVEHDPRRPRDASPRCDADVEAILLKALAKRPEDRYGSAGELARDIAAYLAGDPITARPATLMYFVSKRVRKHRVPIAIAAAVLLTLSSLAAYSYFSERALRQRAQAAEGQANTQAARANAEAARATAEATRAGKLADDLSIELFASRVREAYLEVLNDNIVRANALLQACPVDLRGWEWHFVNRQCHPPSHILFEGAGGKANSVVFSADGTLVAIALQSNEARVFNALTGALRFVLGHNSSVYGVAFSPNGKLIATGSIDQELRIWDAESGDMLRSVKGRCHTSTLAFSPDSKLIAAGHADGRRVVITDAMTGDLVRELGEHTKAVSTVVFSRDGKQIASSNWDGAVRVWRTSDWTQTHTLRHRDKGYGLDFSPDGSRIAVACLDGWARMWDLATGEHIHSYRHVDGAGGNDLRFSADGRQLLTGWGRVAVVWDVESERVVRRLRQGGRPIYYAAFSPDGQTIATGDHLGGLRLWDLGEPDAITTLPQTAGPVHDLGLLEDDRVVAAVTERQGSDGAYRDGEHNAKVWKFDGLDWVQQHALPHDRGVNAVAVSPDAKTIAAGGIDGHIKLWDAAGGGEIGGLPRHADQVTGLAFSQHGDRLFSVGMDGVLNVWDMRTRTAVASNAGHYFPVWQVAISPDGKRIVTSAQVSMLTSGQSGALIYDVADGGNVIGCLTPPERHRMRETRHAVFSPDGRHVVAAFNTRNAGLVARWDARTGKLLNSWNDHRGIVDAVAVSPDGRWIASCAMDGTIHLRDAASGALRHVLQVGGSNAGRLAFDTQATHLAAVLEGGAIRVWKIGEAEPLPNIPSDLLAIRAAVFAPQGRLITASSDGTLRAWDIESGKLIATGTAPAGALTGLAIDATGTHIALGAKDNTVRLLDANSLAEVRQFKGHAYAITGCAFAPDGRLVSASIDGTVRTWDVQTGSQLSVIRPHRAWIHEIAMDAERRRLLTAGADGVAVLWDANGREIRQFVHGGGDVAAVAFHPDGNRIATGGQDGQIHVWSSATGERILRLDPKAGVVHAVAFTLDGRRLVSTGGDSLTFWDLASGKAVAQLEIGGVPMRLRFDRTGQRLFVGRSDGVMILDAGEESAKPESPRTQASRK